MNGFVDHGLDDDAFGAKKGGVVASFDAFPKTKKTYLVHGRNSSAWTVTLIITCIYLSWSEITRWYTGTTVQNFAVEKGVSHDMQINVDIIVPMRCADLRVNMQDAAGDRIIAQDVLTADPTNWDQWTGKKRNKGMHKLGVDDGVNPGFEDSLDVQEQLSKAKTGRFSKTPRLRAPVDACRLYGSFQGNKVQGDFHITARGHGYQESGEHLDHTTFNFSHIIRELSFGPHFPSLENPLDNTIAITPSNEDHFYQFQYYLSLVSTIYTDDSSLLRILEHVHREPSTHPGRVLFGTHAVKTNQYAVTSQSHSVSEFTVPGIFVKFDIEPIMLTIAEEWTSFWILIVRIINVVSGVLVSGGWAWQMYDWGMEIWGRRRRGGRDEGMLGNSLAEKLA